MLKILWDYVFLVRTSIEDWKTTPWEAINVEQMDMDCKKFAKVCQALVRWCQCVQQPDLIKKMLLTMRWHAYNQLPLLLVSMSLKRLNSLPFLILQEIRLLDKEMRAWDTYTGVENVVKNMITSLRAVGDLQNSAIRDRHWQQLMQATGVKFTMDETTTLSDLLSLNLHEFEDEVSICV